MPHRPYRPPPGHPEECGCPGCWAAFHKAIDRIYEATIPRDRRSRKSPWFGRLG